MLVNFNLESFEGGLPDNQHDWNSCVKTSFLKEGCRSFWISAAVGFSYCFYKYRLKYLLVRENSQCICFSFQWQYKALPQGTLNKAQEWVSTICRPVFFFFLIFWKLWIQKSYSEGAVLITSATEHLCAVRIFRRYRRELGSVHGDTTHGFGPQNISKHLSWQGTGVCWFGEVTSGSHVYFQLQLTSCVGLDNFLTSLAWSDPFVQWIYYYLPVKKYLEV